MRSTQKLLFFLLVFLLVFLSSRVWAENPNYNFSLIAVSGQTIDGIQLSNAFNATPCINDAGEVVFSTDYQLSPGNFGTALFSRHHVIAKRGDKIDGHIVSYVSGCALNNAGSVVFNVALQSGKSALVRKDRGSAARLLAMQGETIDGLELQSFGSFLIDDRGETVFTAFYKDHHGDTQVGIFTPHCVLVTPGSRVDGYLLSAIDPLIALSDTRVFFHAFNANIGEGIFSLHQLIVKAGDSVGGFTFVPVGTSAFGYLAASRHGRLAFGATYDGGGGIFTPHRVLVTTPGALPIPSAINDSGDFVYGDSVTGIILNDAPLFAFGDAIDGHVLNGIGLPPAINDRGAVVFTGNFGPDAGVVLATPKHGKACKP